MMKIKKGCDSKLLKGFAALVVWFVRRTRRLRAFRAFDARDSRHWTKCAAMPTALRSLITSPGRPPALRLKKFSTCTGNRIFDIIYALTVKAFTL